MGHKKKTRIYARINDVRQQLFEVRELTDKTLVIVSTYPIYYIDENDKRIPFVKQHYSVHDTNEVDTTITQKTFLEDNPPISNVAYVHNTSSYLLWPVYCRRVGEIKSKPFHARPKDDLHRVAEFRSEKAILLYSIFVAKADFSIKDLTDPHASIFSIKFKKYRLFVIVTFCNMPTPYEGDTAVAGTSTTILGGVKSEGHKQFYTESIPQGDFLKYHWHLMYLLRDKLRERLATIFAGHLSDPEYIRAVDMADLFTKEPVIK